MGDFKPGVYPGVPELAYHAGEFGPDGGSLSSTEAKRILEAPAVYRWAKDRGETPKAAYDFGHIVHALVLGTGLDIVEIPEDMLATNGATSTKAAKEFIASARSAGKIPMKAKDLELPRMVANAVLTNPLAGKIFSHGVPEQSIYAQDDATGVWMRGRIDWTTDADNATLLVDLKTTTSNASPSAFSREAAKLEYAVQREWYRQIWERATGESSPRFIHVVASKAPPYLVGVYEFDIEFEAIGRMKARQALDTYAACVKSGEYPGYAPEISLIGPPAYYVYEADDEEIEVY